MDHLDNGDPSVTPEDEPDEPTEPDESGKRSLKDRSADLKARYEQTRRTLEEQAGVLREKNATARIAFEAYDRDKRHAGALLAGGLAYRLFIWLVPMALVIASLLGVISRVSDSSVEEVAKRAGLAAALTATVAQAASDTGNSSFFLLVIGLWAVLWSGKSVVKALRLLSGVAWQMPPGRFVRSWLASAAFSALALLLLIGPAYLQFLYRGPFIADLIVWTATPLLLGPAFAAGFAWLPHPDDVRWTSLLAGGWLLAFGLQILRIGTAVYFAGRLDRVDDLYGALGVATVFMLWLFIIGRLVVAGMALNAERWRALHPTPPEGADL
jgi:uncharacterized BrkB/YihY/UPF0761 family membrane protein